MILLFSINVAFWIVTLLLRRYEEKTLVLIKRILFWSHYRENLPMYHLSMLWLPVYHILFVIITGNIVKLRTYHYHQLYIYSSLLTQQWNMKGLNMERLPFHNYSTEIVFNKIVSFSCIEVCSERKQFPLLCCGVVNVATR